MITNNERAQLRVLIQEPRFRIIENIVKEMIENIKSQSNLKETEWETAKSVAFEEGQVNGLSKLVQEVYRLAQQENA